MVVNFGVNVLAIIVHVRGVIVDRVIDVSDVGVIYAVDGSVINGMTDERLIAVGLFMAVL